MAAIPWPRRPRTAPPTPPTAADHDRRERICDAKVGVLGVHGTGRPLHSLVPARPGPGEALRPRQRRRRRRLHPGRRHTRLHGLGRAARRQVSPPAGAASTLSTSASTSPADVYTRASAATGSPNSVTALLVSGLIVTSFTSPE